MNIFIGKWCYNNGNFCSFFESCYLGIVWGYSFVGGSIKGGEGEWGKIWLGIKEW